uniref:Uncharacterized protein n=1 Tax=Phytophthora fragariae TaxID=53985 RepID=A0A6A3E668_9STRA|nr:hypothetical protein PF009_g22084 [Phytophthora fragariae]
MLSLTLSPCSLSCSSTLAGLGRPPTSSLRRSSVSPRPMLLLPTLPPRVWWMALRRQAASLHPKMRLPRCCPLRSSFRRQAPGFHRRQLPFLLRHTGRRTSPRLLVLSEPLRYPCRGSWFRRLRLDMLVKRRQLPFGLLSAGRCSTSLSSNLCRVLASIIIRRFRHRTRHMTLLASAGRTLATRRPQSNRYLLHGSRRQRTLWKGSFKTRRSRPCAEWKPSTSGTSQTSLASWWAWSAVHRSGSTLTSIEGSRALVTWTPSSTP